MEWDERIDYYYCYYILDTATSKVLRTTTARYGVSIQWDAICVAHLTFAHVQIPNRQRYWHKWRQGGIGSREKTIQSLHTCNHATPTLFCEWKMAFASIVVVVRYARKTCASVDSENMTRTGIEWIQVERGRLFFSCGFLLFADARRVHELIQSMDVDRIADSKKHKIMKKFLRSAIK